MTPIRFALGRVVITPAAAEAVSPEYAQQCLSRHARCDWGVLCDEDKEINDQSLDGGRLMSAYPIDPAQHSSGFAANTLWIITEADRSTTTLLLPDDY
jgi:hypothetical protein